MDKRTLIYQKALSLFGVQLDNRSAQLLIEVYKRVEEKGDKFSLRDYGEIEANLPAITGQVRSEGTLPEKETDIP